MQEFGKYPPKALKFGSFPENSEVWVRSGSDVVICQDIPVILTDSNGGILTGFYFACIESLWPVEKI